MKRILIEHKPQVCSFAPDDDCSPTAILAPFHQIELYDGSLHFVKNFDLIPQEINEEEYVCYGSGTTYGTKEYCQHNKCEERGTRFCFYSYTTTTKFASIDYSFPIKSWKTIVYINKKMPGKRLLSTRRL